MVKRSSPGAQQTWKTFLENHGHEIFACDFMAQHTALFAVIYVFVVMQLDTRRIVHINVTTQPSLPWVKMQVRHISAFDRKPRFLLHGNDGIFGQFGHLRDGFRCHLDRWLTVTMDIKGLPTPYHAPNVNARVERFHRTLREDALNHFIFLNAAHVGRVVREFIEYYNRARPSQATHAIPDPYPELLEKSTAGGELIAVGGDWRPGPGSQRTSSSTRAAQPTTGCVRSLPLVSGTKPKEAEEARSSRALAWCREQLAREL